ncbi:MAG: hypothetical protein HYY93_02245 [Planctomycetes bacterium]|nr:hypothetical protein [Planctomycetota bacterium]
MAPHTPPPESITRTADDKDRWGNLQDRMRDEIEQTRQEEFANDYKDRLEKYFKILAGEE